MKAETAQEQTDTFDELEEVIIRTRIVLSELSSVAGLPLHVLQPDGSLRPMIREPERIDPERAAELCRQLERVSATLCDMQRKLR